MNLRRNAWLLTTLVAATGVIISMDDPDDNGPTPRQKDGTADLSGIWRGPSGTPLERASGRPAPEALASAIAQTAQVSASFPGARGPSKAGTLRTDTTPPDGGMTTEATARLRVMDQARLERGEADSWLDRNTWERCITRGMPPAALPEPHADHWQIFQTPDLIAILSEALHETRLVHLQPNDTEPPPGWLGHTTARWTGDTLTATTTGFRTDGPEDTTGPSDPLPGAHRGTGHMLEIGEEWTPAGANAIDYTMTVNDPSVYTRPVRYAYRLRRSPPGTAIHEYACHEGNRSMSGMLRGGRQNERRSQLASKVQVASRAWNGHPAVAGPARAFLQQERIPLE